MNKTDLTNEQKAYYREHVDEFLLHVQKNSLKKCKTMLIISLLAFATGIMFLVFNINTVSTKDFIFSLNLLIGYIFLQSAVSMKGIVKKKAISLTFLIKFICGAAMFIYGVHSHASLALAMKGATYYQLFYPACILIPVTISGLFKLELSEELDKVMLLKTMLKSGVKLEFIEEEIK